MLGTGVPVSGDAARSPHSDFKSRKGSGRTRRRLRLLALGLGGTVLVGGIAAGWLLYRGDQVDTELRSAQTLVPKLRAEVGSRDASAARTTLEEITVHTGNARDAVEDPIWTIASFVPSLGPNFSAVRELALAADEVALGSARPLVTVATSMDWNQLGPKDGKLDVAPLAGASPAILSAANTLDLTYHRLQMIDSSTLVGEVAHPLADTTKQLGELNHTLSTVAHTAALLPSMLGSSEARNYLVLVQNSAEVRATGGLPGALALITVDNGSIELVAQSSGSAMAKSDPPIVVDEEQLSIYSSRLGKFIGDVNLTPDFPTAARTAKAMWEDQHGGAIDGVVAIDPVVLAHLLDASGPLPLSNVGVQSGLPTQLTSQNVVPTLLSDVYQAFSSNEAQDEYFAAASREVFQALASGKVSGPALIESLSRSYEENRLHVWSAHNRDQAILGDIPLGGAISGPSTGGASFGVYFNDGTGAKMDYYIRRTVQLEQVCSTDGYSQYNVKISLTNTAPPEAAKLLPSAVTGGGRFGTPAGSVQTNIVAYGPTLSHVDTTTQDGVETTFGSHLHSGRPVGMHSVRLAPGQSTKVEMVFVKVVQNAAPSLSVTPTVEPVKDVTLQTIMSECTVR